MSRLVVALLVAAPVAHGCTAATAPHPDVPAATTDTAVVADRLADLDALLDALATHPDPPDVAAAAADVRQRVGDLTDEAFLTELMRLGATRPQDGHTGIFPLAQPDLELWPLRLYAFEEGWRVIAAAPPHQSLVGREVTAIGGLPVDEVAARLRPLVPHDTDASALGRLPQHLVTTAVLRGIGLDPALELDGQAVDVAPVPAGAYADWAGIWYPLVCPPLVDPDTPAWALEDREDAVVIRYRVVQARVDGVTITQLADELDAAVDRVDPAAVVLDLRDNPGGDTGTARVLVDRLIEVADERPGALRLLVNRCTSSAATNVVVQLLEPTDATVVGEVMGGSPTMWGDAREVTLPSGTVLHVATRTWALGGDDGAPGGAPSASLSDLGRPPRRSPSRRGGRRRRRPGGPRSSGGRPGDRAAPRRPRRAGRSRGSWRPRRAGRACRRRPARSRPIAGSTRTRGSRPARPGRTRRAGSHGLVRWWWSSCLLSRRLSVVNGTCGRPVGNVRGPVDGCGDDIVTSPS
ncbi:hypothetical protein [Euzebya sp.]|uniref:hypothetical protein n=1 Tax=Euzebya sp. TaxID=1971409 RepID=UPI00351571B9